MTNRYHQWTVLQRTGRYWQYLLAQCWNDQNPWWHYNLGPCCNWQVSSPASAGSCTVSWRLLWISGTWDCKWQDWWHYLNKYRFCKIAGTSFLGRVWKERNWQQPGCGRASIGMQTGSQPRPASWWPEGHRERQKRGRRSVLPLAWTHAFLHLWGQTKPLDRSFSRNFWWIFDSERSYTVASTKTLASNFS